MAALLRVKSCNPDGTATLIVPKENCSGSCHSCGGCQEEQREVRAHNPIGAKPGDAVKVRSGIWTMLLIGMVLRYLIPVLTFVGGYLLGEHRWGKGPLVSIIGLAAGFVLAQVLNRLYVKKHILYTIVGIEEVENRG